MKNRISWLTLLLLLLGLLVACGGTEEAATGGDDGIMEEDEFVEEGEGDEVTPLRDSPSFPGATLTLNGIENGQNLPSGTVSFDFDVENFELGAQTEDAGANGLANSAEGQHIHVILNNGPYSAHYTEDFEMELEDGHYVMLAFLSRSYHESVKEPGAAVVRQFTVGDAGEYEEADLSAPHLFYSRPKGTYTGGDTANLMVDFYLLNTELSMEGNKVLVNIDDAIEILVPIWEPLVFKGLPLGERRVKLDLLDGDGNPVPGPFNSVERTVTLAADSES